MRTAIVTGSASGLGRAVAVRLARDGWHVALCDMDEARNAETLAAVTAAGGQGRLEPLNVTDPQAWIALRERLAADWPQLDLLVNNAGVIATGQVGQLDLDGWNWQLDVNLRGVIHGCHTMVEWLKANQRGAHLINIASIAGLISVPAMAAYCATKAAVVAMSESMYVELLDTSVRVSVVCPGFFATRLIETGHFPDEAARQVAVDYTAQSSYSADDVAAAMVRVIGKRRLYVLMPGKTRWYWRMKRLRPQWFLHHVAKVFRKETVKTEARRAGS